MLRLPHFINVSFPKQKSRLLNHVNNTIPPPDLPHVSCCSHWIKANTFCTESYGKKLFGVFKGNSSPIFLRQKGAVHAVHEFVFLLFSQDGKRGFLITSYWPVYLIKSLDFTETNKKRKIERKILNAQTNRTLTICHRIWLWQHSVRALRLRVEARVGHAGECGRVLVGLHGWWLRTVLGAARSDGRRVVRAAGRSGDGRSFRAALTGVVRGAEAAAAAVSRSPARYSLLLLLPCDHLRVRILRAGVSTRTICITAKQQRKSGHIKIKSLLAQNSVKIPAPTKAVKQRNVFCKLGEKWIYTKKVCEKNHH